MAKKKSLLGDIVNRLLFEKNMKAIDLARETGIPQPTVHRIVAGKCTNPHSGTIQSMAQYFDLSVEQLKGDAPLPDALFSKNHIFPIRNQHLIEIPIIAWSDLGNINFQEKVVSDKTIAAMSDLSPSCFAVVMNDSSMEPHFQRGSILIIDPYKTATDRAFVLVKLGESSLFVFRQLLIDADHQFLKPLNPDLNVFKMRLLETHDVIIGCLVESRQVY